ncbi:MAG: hypothetical protein ACK42Z_03655 [Candidatus Kapaibacteriota bacterium]
MQNLNKEIGERLRFVRSIFNEGGKLSATQFARLLGETMHKILNYELGRAQVPPSLLVTLYRRGINPIFILTGEGSFFAPNQAGRELKDKLEKHLEAKGPNNDAPILNQIEDKILPSNLETTRIEYSERNFDELIELARKYTAVAGDIIEIIKRRGIND